jgi:hypothetical protein
VAAQAGAALRRRQLLDAALIDMDKFIVDGGGQVVLLDGRLTIGGTYTQYIFFDRNVDVRPRDPTGEPITAQPPSRNPDGAGHYGQSVGTFNLLVAVKF